MQPFIASIIYCKSCIHCLLLFWARYIFTWWGTHTSCTVYNVVFALVVIQIESWSCNNYGLRILIRIQITTVYRIPTLIWIQSGLECLVNRAIICTRKWKKHGLWSIGIIQAYRTVNTHHCHHNVYKDVSPVWHDYNVNLYAIACLQQKQFPCSVFLKWLLLRLFPLTVLTCVVNVR